jgi:hypothetical protein
MKNIPQYRSALSLLMIGGAILCGATASANAPSGRYVLSYGAHDSRTNLVWREDTAGPYTLANAKSYCSGLSGGSWRVPTIKELVTILDLSATYPPRIDQYAFQFSQPSYYWSSTLVAGTSGTNAWTLHFGNTSMTPDIVTDSWYVRCVR